ncbi:MAG: DNA-processing protein DprA [Ignavibacteria bacterium]|nr:DNA-processing protein DprA [Ignavibacteria bacterium]
MRNFEYTYYLTKIEGLGPVRMKSLLECFGSPERILESDLNELCEVEGIHEKLAQTILDSLVHINSRESDFRTLSDKIRAADIKVLTYSDDDYPENLKKIYDPPAILYYKGNFSEEKVINSIAIVGTRNPTDYGKECTERFASELSSLGITIISGFARGIDTIAHKTAISCEAYTCGVLGCGADIIYPPENKKLYEQMIQKGLILSEYEPGTEPDKINFPKRNRIISGLSLGTLVIESATEGGAMITARSALDQFREVFAVPGRINSGQSSGTNWLIKNSQAKLVDSVDDIIIEIKNNLKDFNPKTNGIEKTEIHTDLKGTEAVIYNTLISKKEAVHIDSISDDCGLNISELLVSLLNLEFRGYVEQLPGKRFKAKIR